MESKPEKGNAPGGRSPEALSVKNPVITQGFNKDDSTQINANRAITVPFHGAELYVVEHNGQPYTPMKPIVSGMGLDWAAQFSKLKANPARWGVAEIAIPTISGVQSMICLPLRKLFGWLAGINVGKIRESLREVVTTYQNECDDALWNYWSEGIAVKKRLAQPAQSTFDYDRISPAQAQDLKQIVQAIVDAGTQNYAETWARLQRKFKVHSYLALHPGQYEEARGYLIAKLPNGYAGDEVESKPAATRVSLDDAVRLDLAFSMSAQAGAQVQRSVFAAVMQGDVDWKTKRFVSNLTYDRMTHQLTAPATRAMDNGEMITSLDKLPKWLNGEDPIFATDEQLANIATACTMRLARSAASRQPALRHDA